MTHAMAAQKIDIPYPDAPELSLLLRTGPCRVKLSPSDGPQWISGIYEDPSAVLPLQVTAGPATTIAQSFDLSAFGGLVLPRLELAIARTRPFALELQAGASENYFDLGGLPISRLVVKAGAGRFDIDFATPNPTTMSTLDLGAGAGAISARRLANANFTMLHFGGGVASCTLDFSGQLLRDASGRIDAGLGSLEIIVPALTPCRVSTRSFASARRARGGFTQQGDAFATTPALQGAHPLLDLDISLAFGSLDLSTT